MHELENEHRTPEAHALALSMMTPENKYLTLRGWESSWNRHPWHCGSKQSARSRSKVIQSGSSCCRKYRRMTRRAMKCVQRRLLVWRVPRTKPRLLGEADTGDHDVLRREAARALRLAGLRPTTAEAKPPANDIDAWKKLLSSSGDASAGRRLFFSPAGPRCSTCHKYGGRGGNVGPDLTKIGRSASRDKIITSILQPSQEIAPDYQAWTLVDSDGKTYTGLRLPKPGDDGQEDYADANGKPFTLASSAIEDRRVASTSIMPENLQAMLSIEDLRDLVTFLAGRQANAPDKPK